MTTNEPTIKDEVRRLGPGLFRGQAYLKTKKRQILVLAFGLEKTT